MCILNTEACYTFHLCSRCINGSSLSKAAYIACETCLTTDDCQFKPKDKGAYI